jgi:hypothetical protein
MDMEIITACRWLPVHMKVALGVSLLTAIAAFALFVSDTARFIRRSKVKSPHGFHAHALLLFLVAAALASVSYYHGVTVPAEIRAYEEANGRSSPVLQHAAAMELRRDLFLPVLSAALALSSLLLGKRNRTPERG